MNLVTPLRAVLAVALLVGLAACTGAAPTREDRAGREPAVASTPPNATAGDNAGAAAPESSRPGDASRVTVARDGAYPRRDHGRFVRVEGRRIDTRPDCSGGGVARIIPGHSGWPSLRTALLGLLKHPGGDRAVVVALSRGRAVAVVFRRDGSVRARSALERFDQRWFPQNIALCRRAFE
jgi:hypothetical protein